MKSYVELAKKWGLGHNNRMIKIPATAAGIGAMEEVAAAGLAINVTLIFTARQYRAARDAIWAGRSGGRAGWVRLRVCYSIFVSRVDVYTEKQIPTLSPAAQGLVGIVNAKRIWRENHDFWGDKRTTNAQAGNDFCEYGN